MSVDSLLISVQLRVVPENTVLAELLAATAGEILSHTLLVCNTLLECKHMRILATFLQGRHAFRKRVGDSSEQLDRR